VVRRLFVLMAILASLLTVAPALAQSAPCQYVLGFATLHALDAPDTGDCLDNQAFAANGDAQQHTTNGLMAWRKADNWTAFTNGYWTWINGPNGLAKRLNTQRYSWEANPDGLPPADQPAPVVHVGAAGLYPDPALTPGEAFANVTAAQVCVPGYSSSVRSVSSAEKAQVYARYGIVNVAGQHEVDHFISLELGGDNALANLWPEPYLPVPGAHQKDTVENYLHAQVCKGTMTLQQAQQAITGDWYAVYLQITG
jgi:hypothetical protein